MKAKRQGAYIAALLTFFLTVFPSRDSLAGFPLLAIVAEAAEIGASMVLRQVGKQAVVAVGVAANDASWVTASSSILPNLVALIGLGTYVGSTSDQKYMVQANPSVPLPTASPIGAYGAYGNPYQYGGGSVLIKTTGATIGAVSPANSTDGQLHKVPAGTYTVAQFLEQLNIVFQYWKPSIAATLNPPYAQYTGGEPRSFYNVSAYYADFEICPSDPKTNLGGSCSVPAAVSGLSVHYQEGADGVYRIKITSDGAGFEPDSSDPDWTAANKFPSANRIAVKGVNAANEPSVVEVGRVSGKTQIKATSQSGSNLKSRVLELNNDMSVASIVESFNPGTVAAYDPATSTGTGTDTGSVVFPSDYARAGEAAQAANTIKTSVDQLKDRLTDSAAVADPEAPQYTNHWGDTFTGLLSWSLPAHTSTCPVATFDAFERTFRMDSHCQLAADYWETLRVAMVVVWVILALFILLRA